MNTDGKDTIVTLISTANARIAGLAAQKSITPTEAAWLRGIRRFSTDEQSELIGRALALPAAEDSDQ